MPVEGTAMGTESTVTYELRDGVAWLGLNRPHKRNAIGEALLAALEVAVRRAQDEARALVIFGHAPASQPASTSRNSARGSRRRCSTAPAHGTRRSPCFAMGPFPRSPRCTERRSGAGSSWPPPATSASPTRRHSSRYRRARVASMWAAAPRCTSRGCSALRGWRT
jgi:hypothetical protein